MHAARTILSEDSIKIFFFVVFLVSHQNGANGSFLQEQIQRSYAVKTRIINHVSNLFRSFRPQADYSVCKTDGCNRIADQILSYMNESVSPCDDFYEFACGNFKDQPAPRKGGGSSNFMKQRLNDELATIVSKLSDSERKTQYVPRFHSLIKNSYHSCVDKDRLNSLGLKPMQDKIEEMGGWPVVQGIGYDLRDFSIKKGVDTVFKTGFSKDSLFLVTTHPDIKNSTVNRIAIVSPYDNGVLSENSQSLAIMRKVKKYCEKGDWWINKLIDFAVKVATLFGASSVVAAMDMVDVVEFECFLVNLTLSDEIEKAGEFPQVPFGDLDLSNFSIRAAFPQNFSVHRDEIIIDLSPKYTTGLRSILDNIQGRVLQNYLMYRIVRTKLPYLNTEAQELYTSFSETIMSRDDYCLRFTKERFEAGLTHLYLHDYISTNVKPGVEKMFENVLDEFRHSIKLSNWMDNLTRGKAVGKVDKLLATVVYLDEFWNASLIDQLYERFDWDRDNLLTSELRFTSLENDFQNLRKPKDRTSWESRHRHQISLGPFYEPQTNRFWITPVYTRYPEYMHDVPRYINYGRLGFTFAREMTHIFDSLGSQYDESGNLQDWWQPETKEKFKERQSCLISQYSNYTYQERSVNGKMTVEENMADNFAVGALYKAKDQNQRGYDTLDDLKLPGLQKYSKNQMFWIALVSGRCSKVAYKGADLHMGRKHTPPPVRVKGLLSNSQQFLDDFQCIDGSVMNPSSKCQVW